MTEVSVDKDIDRLRREFEKLPIDQQLSKLRDGLWTMVDASLTRILPIRPI
jgi:hypothetical protein